MFPQFFLLYAFLVTILIAIPFCNYNKSKSEHQTVKKTSSFIIGFFFPLQILVISTSVFVILRFFFDNEKRKYFFKFFVIYLFCFACSFWIANIVIGIVFSINPSKSISSEEIDKIYSRLNSSYLLGYVYGSCYTTSKTKHSKRGAKTTYHNKRYTLPFYFNVELIDSRFDEFNKTEYPEDYGIEIKLLDEMNQNVKNLMEKGRSKIREFIKQANYKQPEIFFGFYPDIQDHKYILKSSKYGQAARIFAAIFGVSPYYDLATSGLSEYSLNVSRSVGCDNNEGYIFEQEFIKQKPDLEEYYKKAFK